MHLIGEKINMALGLSVCAVIALGILMLLGGVFGLVALFILHEWIVKKYYGLVRLFRLEPGSVK